MRLTEYERIKDIHNRIASGSFPKVKPLKEIYGVSVATINRDIAKLKGNPYCAPIAHNSKGYYYSKEYNFPYQDMTPKQLQILSTAKTLLSFCKGTPLYKESEGLIDSLALNYQNKSMLNRIALPPTSEIEVEPEIWNGIVKAMEESKIIHFFYTNRISESSSWFVHPYQVLLDDGFCYLWGYSEERKDMRLFNLSRIKRINLLMKSFVLPDNYEFEKNSGGGKFGAFSRGMQVRFEIDFYDDARAYVRGRRWAEDQELIERNEDNTTTIIFSASQYDRILEWVMAQGPKAKPIGPECFVEDWKNNIKKMARSIEIF